MKAAIWAILLLFIFGCSGEQGRDAGQGNSASPAAGKVTFLEFYATWCRPCKMQAPVYEKLKREFRGIKFVKVNVDKNRKMAREYRVRSIPYMLVMVDGKIKKKLKGYHPYEKLRPILENYSR
jgi:thioredoxin 1